MMIGEDQVWQKTKKQQQQQQQQNKTKNKKQIQQPKKQKQKHGFIAAAILLFIGQIITT